MNSSSRFELACADQSHLQEVSDLVNSAYRGDSSRAGWTTEADFMGGLRTDPERLASELSDGSNRTLLFLREVSTRAMVGCVFLERFEDEAGVGCYLGMLTVSPTLQDQGLGRLLLDHAEEYAKKTWGASRMTLGVIQLRESLMAWYERRGYKKTGMTKPFPYDQLTTDAPKRNDLYFVMFEKPI